MKCCRVCKVTKARTDFYPRPESREGITSECKECRKARSKRWWRNEGSVKTCRKAYHRKRAYGLDATDFARMFTLQDEKCAICKGTMKKIDVDHDHLTKKVRGLLCHRCNTALGFFQDSVDVLSAAIDYLNKNKEQN